jgi:tRNA acetyltransferase TAN1
MLDGDSFRITVEKRHTQLRSSDIISAVARRIRNHVNLDQPDWTILIEIIGGQTGVSVLRKDDIFSSVVEKRQ